MAGPGWPVYFYHMQSTLKHIAVIAPYRIYPAKMGGQKGIAFFYAYLSRLLPLHIISTADNIFPVQENTTFHPLLGTSKLRYINPFLFFRMRQFIRKQQITHLIIEHPYYGWLGILLKYSCGVQLVVHSHNIEAVRFKSIQKWWWGILWNYEKLTHRKADLNFFIHDADREFAIKKFKLSPAKCLTITYGFEMAKAPDPTEKNAAKKQLCDLYGISEANKLLLFNGTLGYGPNREALDIILQKINPILLNSGITYKIIICGSKLPAVYEELAAYHNQHIIYAGFVDDINLYFCGADIFINPVMEGGGIKTKVVEALGHNLSVISTQSGATGIPAGITGDKLTIVNDQDWEGFARCIATTNTAAQIPGRFFDHFYWGNIAQKAAAALSA